jgi:hypothetical protein
MVKCKDCKEWDREFMACKLGPYEIENLRCLLKNILAVVLNNTEEPDDEDYWKK